MEKEDLSNAQGMKSAAAASIDVFVQNFMDAGGAQICDHAYGLSIDNLEKTP